MKKRGTRENSKKTKKTKKKSKYRMMGTHGFLDNFKYRKYILDIFNLIIMSPCNMSVGVIFKIC